MQPNVWGVIKEQRLEIRLRRKNKGNLVDKESLDDEDLDWLLLLESVHVRIMSDVF
jgi:hypothetical protein